MFLKNKRFSVALLGFSALMMSASILPVSLSSAVAAEAVKNKGIVVAAAYAKASIGTLKNSAAFMSVLNHGTSADKVIGVKSDIAKRVELHTHIKEGDIMKMRKVAGFDVPASGFVDLEPGGHHIMLIGLHKALKAGDKFSLTLTFEKAGEKTVELVTKGLKKVSHEDHHKGSGERGSHH